MIYLDNAATTKIDEEVLEAMMPYLTYEYGNPNAKFYDLAINAKKALDNARNQVAALLKCNSKDVIFNSGATEGNNTILKGISEFNNYTGNIITTKIEHESIYEVCEYLKTKGMNIKYIEVDHTGTIKTESLNKLIDSETKLISIGLVNHEIGTIQPIDVISKICYDKCIPLLVDATQAVGRIKIDLTKNKGISFLTFSAHKINGPKGTGVLINQKNKNDEYYQYVPLIIGGNQEKEQRAGTQNVPGIVGCGKACEIMNRDFDKIMNKIKIDTENQLIFIKEQLGENVIINNNFENIAPGIINIRFKCINNEVLLHKISNEIAASSGSVCSNLKYSRTLLEIGLTEGIINESIRFSF